MNRAHLFLIALAISLFFVLPAAAQQKDPVVELQTTKGNIYIRVFYGAVPRTASNFLDLVSRGFYDGKIFHRIETWCIQGGDPNGNGTGDFVDPNTGQVRYVPLEINRRLSHSCAGVVAMARKNNPNSASCQFYITKQSTKFLDGRYAIFGQVVQGLNAVRNMQRGDQIVSARIIDSQDNNQSNSNSPPQTRPSPRGGPTPEYEPTSEVPNDGF